MTLAGEVFDSWVKAQAGGPEVVPVNRDAIAIVRLFLEKLEQFSPEERKELIAVIRFLNMPPMIIWNEQKAVWEPNGTADTR